MMRPSWRCSTRGKLTRRFAFTKVLQFPVPPGFLVGYAMPHGREDGTKKYGAERFGTFRLAPILGGLLGAVIYRSVGNAKT